MGRKLVCCVAILYLLDLSVTCSGSSSSVTMKKATRFTSTKNKLHPKIKQQNYPPPSRTSKKDITNPITTVPNIIPAPFASTIPVINPTSNPETAPPTTVMTPMSYPSTTVTAPPSLSSSWCIASQSVSQMALQVALDYACGYGGADCSAILAGGNCYYPNTVRDHASYAFNQYYQKNPIPTSCNFAGTAVVTSTDPSSGTCQYPSTSTSSSILNTTNSSGATVFGAVPSGPTPTTSDATRFPALPCSLVVVSVSPLLYTLFKL